MAGALSGLDSGTGRRRAVGDLARKGDGMEAFLMGVCMTVFSIVVAGVAVVATAYAARKVVIASHDVYKS